MLLHSPLANLWFSTIFIVIKHLSLIFAYSGVHLSPYINILLKIVK